MKKSAQIHTGKQVKAWMDEGCKPQDFRVETAISAVKKPFCTFVVESIRYMQTAPMVEGIKEEWASSGLTWMEDNNQCPGRAEEGV